MARFPQENPNPVLRAATDGVLLKANPASADLLAHLSVALAGPGRLSMDATRQGMAHGR